MIKLLSLIKEQVGSDLPDVSLATYLSLREQKTHLL